MSDGTRGAPDGVDNEPPERKKPYKECPYCRVATQTLPNHLRTECEVVNDE